MCEELLSACLASLPVFTTLHIYTILLLKSASGVFFKILIKIANNPKNAFPPNLGENKAQKLVSFLTKIITNLS